MLETLRAWLNGDREYFSGVIIYLNVGDDDALKKLFAKGKTDYCHQRLQSELLGICNELKAKNEVYQKSGKNEEQDAAKEPLQKAIFPNHHYTVHKDELDSSKLYEACKQEAGKAYKEVMNLRAQLFALAPIDDRTDLNTEQRINQRSKLAVDVADKFKHVSELYDKADYVKLHGRLPNDGEPGDTEKELNVDGLPESQVKQTLDNLRKNYNKMAKREVTPERVALMQKHATNIKKLEERWRLLQQPK